MSSNTDALLAQVSFFRPDVWAKCLSIAGSDSPPH
jgi:hypothetical protein